MLGEHLASSLSVFCEDGISFKLPVPVDGRHILNFHEPPPLSEGKDRRISEQKVPITTRAVEEDHRSRFSEASSDERPAAIAHRAFPKPG